MKKYIIISTVFLSLFCIKAQTLSLSSPIEKISNGVYLKDMDNTLPLFTGTWIANFEGKQITLYLNKIERFSTKLKGISNIDYYSDVLFMKYMIKDSSGNQIISTANKTVNDMNIITSLTASPLPDRKIGFIYSGEECGIGRGLIFLTYIDSTHIKWEYNSTGGIIDPTQCTNYSPNIKSYIPRTLDLTFTKQ
ncbi:hypothetical protein M2T82_12530 [Elizabethkingia ursingii]|uniref:DUF6705 family protein n=1 Tax=Elizabethkingia ursingii TaxID=1756150 RepID=UPI0020112F28|nr:DUF6705 family protein [Elizabethkingia ursingii]MCL1668891.1 hypothetical protein [Elizabethkingia ursingii]